MKKIYACLSLLLVILSLPSIAQQKDGGKSLLWKITGNGLTKPSYLFGTIDFICPGNYIWTNNMQECLAKSDKVCLSVDMSDTTLKKQVLQEITNPNGKKLQDYFTPVDYAIVRRYAADSLHVNMDKIPQFKPIAIQPMIVRKLLGCTDVVSYDLKITAEATRKHIPVTGIESVKEAYSVLDEITFNDKIARTLTEMATGSRYYHNYRHDIMQAYIHQDIQAVSKDFRSATLFTPADLDMLLNAASKRWTSRMPALMQQGTIFFALNSIYFGGDDGIISMLKKAGYTVEPVN